ncbi:tetratricopeptide repeat protein [Azospirillum doebereinerae]|uniref:Tetratricopeptide repeat protein n=1 Tax=Azospirillum doebereinerae TaxID=92933 RepID=A0A3S0V047_9PROT|nr:tetratricopeptide repeat protein [Azospirillum doebereinerae]MCG5238243.1 tetratricopeptide repeat protein [Azospirillum doebereinerae]RUQ68168.1 tetratricopeptide repeat protein [Azospirillum doebereinerae]
MVSLRDALAAAVGHHRAGRLDRAEALYHSILRAVPDQPDALHLLGVLDGQDGRQGLALRRLRLAVAARPDDADTLNDLALTLRAAGQAGRAAGALGRALRLEPALPQAAYNLGNLLRDGGDPEGAVGWYRQALAHRADYPEAWNNLGMVLSALGRTREAADAFAEALARRPEDADLRINRANALDAVGGTAAAARLRRQALTLAPAGADVLHNLAVRLLGEAGMDRPVVAGRPLDHRKLARGLGWLRRALIVRRDHAAAGDALIGAALKLLQAGLADDALVEAAARAAPQALARDSQDTRAAAMIAYRFYRRGRADRGARWMRRVARRFTAGEAAADFELRTWSLIRPDRDFLDRLPGIDALLDGFPPLESVFDPPPGEGPLIAVSCDDVYFRRFVGDLLDSIETAGGGEAVHVHVVNPSAETEADLAVWRARLPLGFSRERVTVERWDAHRRATYYACIRFIRWHQLLDRHRRPLVHVDADCTLLADLGGFAEGMRGADAGLLRDGRGRGPTREITVCFAWFQPTPDGRRFLALTAAAIADALRRGDGWWMLDQAAPFCVLDALAAQGEAPVLRWFDWMDFPWIRFIGDK